MFLGSVDKLVEEIENYKILIGLNTIHKTSITLRIYNILLYKLG